MSTERQTRSKKRQRVTRDTTPPKEPWSIFNNDKFPKEPTPPHTQPEDDLDCKQHADPETQPEPDNYLPTPGIVVIVVTVILASALRLLDAWMVSRVRWPLYCDGVIGAPIYFDVGAPPQDSSITTSPGLC
ncbi:hypothetical protein BO70DRAFT_114137 [Aspergillus heteromorphus CBS 117.55]|uniref:Uncharacterized protein n=1 Tax=Aspergillus heteromorphus CBS 117.55 TaxID=1448321 RepID=A0A317VIE6_9EURO|nr:uncharacterized protein BO70DRAFT_114137 [Aspergillus heteromorphus CBS 117.55]PWY72991.1 hypothetical protein BO70DRAFT_114137 [Aspergillus heteromorphus CBS 117.55]